VYTRHRKVSPRKWYNLKTLIVLFLTEEGASTSSNVRIDKIDLKIIRALQKDARTNFADIARDCGVSTDTISKRFRKMKKAGAIRGTTILLNPKSFGYECVGSFGVDVSYPHLIDVVKSIQKIPEIIICATSMGKHNIFCIAVLKNVGRLSQVKDLIKGHPAVRDVTTSIWVDEILLCPENFEFKNLER
jgi:Lrp/AsnC family transcriptional regulator for asnA, asnC and gidA